MSGRGENTWHIRSKSGSCESANKISRKRKMSLKSLKSQLEDDYLTCSICLNSFIKPKALPCLHTYCKGCLRDYIVSRGYETLGTFPCPVCRNNTTMPETGVEGFPDNYLMSSLSETVANSQPTRPKPKPRRSLGPPQAQKEDDDTLLPSSSSVTDMEQLDYEKPEITSDSSSSKMCLNDTGPDWVIVSPQSTPSAPEFHVEEEDKSNFASGCTVPQSSHQSVPTSLLEEPTKGSDSSLSQVNQSTFQNDRFIAPVQPPPYSSNPESSFPVYPYLTSYTAIGAKPEPATSFGWDPHILGDSLSRPVNPENTSASIAHDPKASSVKYHGSSKTSQALYPAVPAQSEHSNLACTENLILKFGKQGSSNRDFLKPVGIAVSKEGNYVISDSSGNQNRIFIFNSGGQLVNAFNCGCKVKDVTMTKGNEILAAVHKTVSSIRHFTMQGQLKGEYGKFFTFEEPCGIGQLANGGVAISGTQNNCVYILTDQMKLATKFGRKGNGDGYFQHPGYVAVDSKNHIIVSDKVNNCVQVFNSEGKFRHRFGTPGKNKGQLDSPLGVCVDDSDNIIVANSGNFRVEVFSSKGQWLRSVVINTQELGNEVKPVNVAFTPTGQIAVLLRGPYFAEVRVYSSKHNHLVQKEGLVSTILSSTSAMWYSE